MLYKILVATADAITQLVQYHIDDGWELVGAPFVLSSTHCRLDLAQAVVRPSEPSKSVSRSETDKTKLEDTGRITTTGLQP